MFSKSIDEDPARLAIRDAFLEDTRTWVGARYSRTSRGARLRRLSSFGAPG